MIEKTLENNMKLISKSECTLVISGLPLMSKKWLLQEKEINDGKILRLKKWFLQAKKINDEEIFKLKEYNQKLEMYIKLKKTR